MIKTNLPKILFSDDTEQNMLKMLKKKRIDTWSKSCWRHVVLAIPYKTCIRPYLSPISVNMAYADSYLGLAL